MNDQNLVVHATSSTRVGSPEKVERVTGIEPAFSAWEADVLPLNYTRRQPRDYRRSGEPSPVGRGPEPTTVRVVILSDRSLREALAAGRIIIDPLDEAMIQPSSIDVRLHNLFRVFRTTPPVSST
jgi:hypothetical protein